MGRNGEEKRNGKKEVTRAASSAVLRYFRCIERRFSRIFARSTGTNWKTIVSGITMAYGENVNVDTTVDVTASVRDSCASLALKSQATR